MIFAERIADSFTQTLDMSHLSDLQILILHGIKSVAISEWAKETLAKTRGGN
jgi:hypothetical protein